MATQNVVFTEWLDEYKRVAKKRGWPMPTAKIQGMFWRARKVVWDAGAHWPTWDEVEAGMDASESWPGGAFRPSSPGWLLAIRQDGTVNIQAVPNWVRRKPEPKKTELPRCPRRL